jgi:HEPN domain-containing protein
MQRDPAELAYRWYDQAAADLDAGERNAEAGIAYLACFLAQQSAEKALKALLYWTRGDWPRIHLIETLLRELAPEHAPRPELADDARSLDKYYTTTRYPDVLDHALPAASFVRREADGALAVARAVLEFVGTHLPPRPAGTV